MNPNIYALPTAAPISPYIMACSADLSLLVASVGSITGSSGDGQHPFILLALN